MPVIQRAMNKLARYVSTLRYFDKTHGMKEALTDYLSRHPTEEATTEEYHDEDRVINTYVLRSF